MRKGRGNPPLLSMTKRLLDWDPIHQVGCYFSYRDGTVTMTHEQDVSAILDANRADANNDELTKHGIKNDWWKYASIPAVVEMQWLQKYGVDLNNPGHKKKIFKLLNSPEYSYLKTTRKVHNVNAD